MAIFGYMNGMIFAKWFAYSAIGGEGEKYGSACAPSILITLINMFLYKYPDDPKQPCYLDTWYPGQKYVQTSFLLLALFCVPWMLVLKPWYLSRQNKRETERTTIQIRDTAILISSEMENSEQTGQGGNGEDGGRVEEFDLGDVITHQAIHTIEYCLGSISHTASYLRLWALSLAHAQLSEIVWTVFTIGINDMGFGNVFNAIIMCYVFAFWSCLTISVLLLIEGLSAFLHALRLHWVEFQSKFYGGSGFAFQPFAFEAILELADKESAAEMSS
jgi:V-type H+-transporting ATPase subunit a